MIAWLDGASALDVARAGGKGSSLARLAAAGLPVPRGFVVTTDAYRAFHDAAALDQHIDALRSLAARPPLAAVKEASAGLLAALEGAELPKGTRAAVEAAFAELVAQTSAGATFAVRSSAAAEDGATASFAGLYESCLNLSGAEAVCEAVVRCYRSLWQPRAVQYRTIKSIDHATEAMAVVGMQTVQAAVSGVAFTMNPLTGSRDELVVNASWGLGEAVVSGLVTPDSCLLTAAGDVLAEDISDKSIEAVPAESGTTTSEIRGSRATQACLEHAQLRQVAEAATHVEQFYGSPVDIEFAFDAGGRFFLLQARPITTR